MKFFTLAISSLVLAVFVQFVNGLPSDVHRGTTGGTTEPDRRSVQSKASSRSSFSGHLDNGHVETVTVPTLPSSGSGSQSKPKQTGVLKKILSYIPFVGSKSPGSTPTPTEPIVKPKEFVKQPIPKGDAKQANIVQAENSLGKIQNLLDIAKYNRQVSTFHRLNPFGKIGEFMGEWYVQSLNAHIQKLKSK